VDGLRREERELGRVVGAAAGRESWWRKEVTMWEL